MDESKRYGARPGGTFVYPPEEGDTAEEIRDNTDRSDIARQLAGDLVEALKRQPRYTFDAYHTESMANQSHTFSPRDTLVNAALGLGGEAGEVQELVKKHVAHGKDLDREKMLLELGDVLWYVMFAAEAIGKTLEDVALANRAKLRARYPNGFTIEAARAKPDGAP